MEMYIDSNYHSFKNFFPFLIASNPQLILHNQLALTKFRRRLRSAVKWRQKSRMILEKGTKTEMSRRRGCVWLRTQTYFQPSLLSGWRAFSSPEPVVSWSRGREMRGYKSSRVALGTRMGGERWRLDNRLDIRLNIRLGRTQGCVSLKKKGFGLRVISRIMEISGALSAWFFRSFSWRWGTPGRWDNPLRWGNPTCLYNLSYGLPPII